MTLDTDILGMQAHEIAELRDSLMNIMVWAQSMNSRLQTVERFLAMAYNAAEENVIESDGYVVGGEISEALAHSPNRMVCEADADGLCRMKHEVSP